MTYGPYLYTKGAEDAWALEKEMMAKYKPNVELNSQTNYGWGVAETIVEALKAAGPDLTPEMETGAREIERLTLAIASHERELNAAVYGLFNLSPEEIALIEHG